MIVNDLLDYGICKIFCWIRLVDKNKFAIFNKTFYNDKDIIIINIINRVFKFK